MLWARLKEGKGGLGKFCEGKRWIEVTGRIGE